MVLGIIIEIEICGLINVGECFFCGHWNLVIPINPWGVRHPIEQCGMLTPFFFYIFLDEDITSNNPQVEAGRTLGCPWRCWSCLVGCGVFVVFVGLELVLVNYELWICNKTLFWLNCLTVNFYFWTVMIIIISCCF